MLNETPVQQLKKTLVFEFQEKEWNREVEGIGKTMAPPQTDATALTQMLLKQQTSSVL